MDKPSTPIQAAEFLELYRNHTTKNLSEITGKAPRTLRRWRKHAENLYNDIQPGQSLDGVSIQQKINKKTGEWEDNIRWVKSKKENNSATEYLQRFADGLSEEISPIDHIKPPLFTNEDLVNFIPLADQHVGMFANGIVTGGDFNLDIASKNLKAAFKTVIDSAPDAETCVISNLGDFFHAENMRGITAASGHILDMADHPKVIMDEGVKMLRFCIEHAARKHKTVHVFNCPGNHDEILSHFMNTLLANVYENNDRIIIHNGATDRYYYRFGKVLMGFVHNHKTKLNKLPIVMATEKPQDWSESEYRYWFTGHYHHTKEIDHQGVMLCQLETLTLRDTHAATHAYLSKQSLQCRTFHKEYGPWGTNYCTLARLGGDA